MIPRAESNAFLPRIPLKSEKLANLQGPFKTQGSPHLEESKTADPKNLKYYFFRIAHEQLPLCKDVLRNAHTSLFQKNGRKRVRTRHLLLAQ